MLSKNNLEEILTAALKNGGDWAEVFIEETQSTVISCEDNKIEKVISGKEAGAGIRLILGEETLYATSNELDLKSLKETTEKLSSTIKTTKASPPKINLEEQKSPLKFTIEKPPETVPLKEKVKVVEKANTIARTFGENIRQVTVGYADNVRKITVANSLGNFAHDEQVHTRLIVNVIAAKGKILQTGYEGPGGTAGFELFDQYSPQKVAEAAAKRALLMLEAKHAPVGKMPIIMTSEAGGVLIHEACGHALEADFIHKETSVFGGKIGQKVASDLVTVIDDATMPGHFGSFKFDDEGIPAEKTILIENGILKEYMCDQLNGNLIKRKSTGNGRRQSFHNKPVPRMTNTYIAPGKTDPQEIISSVKNGLLVKKMGGGEVNVVNGDFVFEVSEGYLIENGKISYPVRGAILIGNGPQILKQIDIVGSDLGFLPGVCGKYDHAPVSDGQPTLRVPELIVGGR